jgi:hypothetical protein
VSYGFNSEETRTARKAHKCEHCRKPIDIGAKYRRSAGVFEGGFYCWKEHSDCHEAWETLNFSRDQRDLDGWEGALPLYLDDHEPEDRLWMREEFPAVAARLGWEAA